MDVIMLAHRPPPMHGAALVGDVIFNILQNNNKRIAFINLSTSSSVGEIGRFGKAKLKALIFIYISLWKEILGNRYKSFYFSPAVTGKALFRDFFYFFNIRFLNFISFQHNVRILMHIHMQPDEKLTFLKRIMLKVMFWKTEIIFADKSLVNSYPKNFFKSSKLHFIPYFIKPICTKNEVIDKWSKNKEKNTKFNLLYIGHLIESKGYKRALDVAAELKKENFPFQMNFVGAFGEHSDKIYFEDFVRVQGLSEMVKYLGEKYDEAKKKVFISSDLMILPSYREQYPLSIPEAFSSGIPVVATDTGAISSIIGLNKGMSVASVNLQDKLFIEEFSRGVICVCNSWDCGSALSCQQEFESKWSEESFISEFLKLTTTQEKTSK